MQEVETLVFSIVFLPALSIEASGRVGEINGTMRLRNPESFRCESSATIAFSFLRPSFAAPVVWDHLG